MGFLALIFMGLVLRHRAKSQGPLPQKRTFSLPVHLPRAISLTIGRGDIDPRTADTGWTIVDAPLPVASAPEDPGVRLESETLIRLLKNQPPQAELQVHSPPSADPQLLGEGLAGTENLSSSPALASERGSPEKQRDPSDRRKNAGEHHGSDHRGHSKSLPPPLHRYFQAKSQEVVIWYAPTKRSLFSQGILAITNRRILTIQWVKVVQMIPPGFVQHPVRQECPLSAVTGFGFEKTQRPILLAVGLPLAFWFPFGTLTACLSLTAYALWWRQDLALAAGSQRRVYALERNDAVRAIAALKHAKAQSKITQRPGKLGS